MAKSTGKKSAPIGSVGFLGAHARTIALLLLGVIALHGLVLHGLARALSSVEPLTPTGPVFTARTVVLESPQAVNLPAQASDAPAPLEPSQTARPTEMAGAPRAVPAPAKVPAAPEPPLLAAPTALPSGIADAPQADSTPTTLLAQGALEPLPSGPTGAAMPSANPSSVAAPVGAVRSLGAGMPDYDYLVPGSVRLKYKGSGTKGFLALPVSAELLWSKDARAYEARLELSLLGFSRVQTSKGAVGPRGLDPLSFGDKTRSEETAQFQRAKGIVSFSGNGPDAALMPLAQDLLSVYVQLASMWGANPARFSPGTPLPFQLVEKHRAGTRVFTVGATERLRVEGRELVATRLVCEASPEYDNRVEVWLAPALQYLPARIRMTQVSGDEVDIFWSSSEKP